MTNASTDRSLADQMAVITGASSGIGRCIALGLSRKGMSLCLIGRNQDALQALRDEVAPTPVRIFEADFTVDAQLTALQQHLAAEIEKVDVLIHSAGAHSMAAFHDAPIETFDWLYRINVRAPFVLTQTLLPKLVQQKGQVVFLNSSVGIQAKAKVSQYAATKHALKAIADSLRDEVNGAGVRVLSLYAGRTATPMQASIYQQQGRDYNPDTLTQPEDIADVVLNALLLPRTAEITDIHIRPTRKD